MHPQRVAHALPAACRAAGREDGAKPDAALVDSLAAGLAAAVPRLTMARDALAAWLTSDMTSVLDLATVTVNTSDKVGQFVSAAITFSPCRLPCTCISDCSAHCRAGYCVVHELQKGLIK